ncbi:hypothetical protein Tco_1119293, partial [Tanacetum coccineum]
AEIGGDTDKTNSEGDTEILNIGEEQGEGVSNKVDLEEKTAKIDEGHAGSDPGKTHESRPLPERVLIEENKAGPNPGQSHVALVGPNPEPMHDDFIAIVYPNVHESLKHTTEEHVHLENPLSSLGTLSSMKNLEDNFTFGDQFINDKPMKEDTGKTNMETKVESMVTTPIHQAVQEPSFTATTVTTTTTLAPPPPPQQQSTINSALAAHVTALEQIFANFEKKNKYVNENVKEVVQDALQAPVRERFRELSKFEMKEILYDRMFESGSYRSLPKHTTLYEAVEASIERENRKVFMDVTTKSRKRRCDDQDPPLLTSKGSSQRKKTRNDSDASGSK